MRPGRIDRVIYIPPPDEEARHAILKIHTSKMTIVGVDLKALAKATHGYTGAEIARLCEEAAMHALRADIEAKHVSPDDFKAALKVVKPRLTEQQIRFYEQYNKGEVPTADGEKKFHFL